MPLLSSSLPNLVNGVSQQAPGLRLTSQMEAQENALSSIVEGLGKRPPTQHIKRLGVGDISNAYLHTINRDASERYTVVIEDSAIRVYDMAGTAKTVATPDGVGYINTVGLAKDVIRATTVADYTFIVNTEKVPAMSNVATDYSFQSIVFVKQGQYSTDYIVYANGFEAAKYTTSASTASDLATNNIASELAAQLVKTFRHNFTSGAWTESSKTLTKTGAFTGYTWASGDRIYIGSGGIVQHVVRGIYTIASKTSNDAIVLTTSISSTAANATGVSTLGGPVPIAVKDSTIHLDWNNINGANLSITASDSFGDRALSAVNSSTQRFSDLPTVAPGGFQVEIRGDDGVEQDNYWVTFRANDGGTTLGKGLWVETARGGIYSSFDATTMPHILVRESDGSFTFKKATWDSRSAGDATTAPEPSFIGASIQDVFFHRDRLGFLTGDNVVMSGAGDFFNFWPGTVTTILDSDPIDVASTSTKAGSLKHALPFREELLLFSDQAQFVLNGGDLLTPATVSINQTTEFDATAGCRPVGAGKNIYFGFPRGSFSGLWEYFVQSDTDSKDAADVTAHVPKYLPGSIIKLAVSGTENVLVALSSTDQDAIYVYKYYWSNDQKLQSSWSRFSLETNCKVLNADFIESTLYLVVQRSDGNHLEKMQFEAGQTDTGSTYVTLLDRRLTEAQVSISYNAGTNVTTWTLPYAITGTMRVVARAGDVVLPEGARITLLTSSGTTITATGDYRTSLVYIGQVYTLRVRFSEQIPREEARGGGQAQVLAGRNQIRYVTVSYNETGYFSTEVTPTGRSLSEKVFTQVVPSIGGPALVTLKSGKFRFPVLAQTSQVVIELVSDSHLPCHFTGAEFETFYHTRSQRA